MKGFHRRHSAQRRTTVWQVLTEHGLPYDPLLVEDGARKVEGGYAATHRLLDRASGITAISVQKTSWRSACSTRCTSEGVESPMTARSSAATPTRSSPGPSRRSTTVHLPFFDAGAAAVRLLLDRIASGSTSPVDAVLPVSMVCRASTASAGRKMTGR
ncbi:hypothetical protein AB0J43_23590 [Nonomuraea fuscirosea]